MVDSRTPLNVDPGSSDCQGGAAQRGLRSTASSQRDLRAPAPSPPGTHRVETGTEPGKHGDLRTEGGALGVVGNTAWRDGDCDWRAEWEAQEAVGWL